MNRVAAQLLAAIVVVLALAIAGLATRYELVAGSSSSDSRGNMYRLDRWTGNVQMIFNSEAIDVRPMEESKTAQLPASVIQQIDTALLPGTSATLAKFRVYNGSKYRISKMVFELSYPSDGVLPATTKRYVSSPLYSIGPMSVKSEVAFEHDQLTRGNFNWKIVEVYGSASD